VGRNEVLAARAHRRELEHRASALGHRTTDAEQLVLRGERAGDRLAVHRAVTERARGGEPQRAGLDRFLHDAAMAAMSSDVAGSLRAPRSPIT
jgi:hypothetical protein